MPPGLSLRHRKHNRKRTAAKKGLLQRQIVKALRQMGIRVAVLNNPGLPNLLLYDPRGGHFALIKCKGRLTHLQQVCKLPFYVCRSVEEAIDLLPLPGRSLAKSLHHRPSKEPV